LRWLRPPRSELVAQPRRGRPDRAARLPVPPPGLFFCPFHCYALLHGVRHWRQRQMPAIKTCSLYLASRERLRDSNPGISGPMSHSTCRQLIISKAL
jgi:hypothetical protein